MITKYFKQFFTATEAVLTEYGIPDIQLNPLTSNSTYDIFTSIGFTGDCKGIIALQFCFSDADSFVQYILDRNGLKVSPEDFIVFRNSTVGELGNQIAGRTMQILSEIGVNGNITPPTIISGNEISADFTAANLVQHKSVDCSLGSFCLSVGFRY